MGHTGVPLGRLGGICILEIIVSGSIAYLRGALSEFT